MSLQRSQSDLLSLLDDKGASCSSVDDSAVQAFFFEGEFFPPELINNPTEFSELCSVDHDVDLPSQSLSASNDGSDGSFSERSKRRKLVETEEQKKERRKRVAAASRATRAKRKQEKDDLKDRNAKLEEQREHFLERIADLQMEVQSLRQEGTINLEKENRLLRIEIEKHKSFINVLLNATNTIPKYTLEEQYRLVCSGCSSAIAQVVGISLTCVVDQSWIDANVEVFDPNEMRRRKLPVKIQMLPLGCDFKTMKRANFVVDLGVRKNCSIQQLQSKLWRFWSDPEAVKKVWGMLAGPDCEAIFMMDEMDTGFTNLRQQDDPEVKLFRYKEIQKQSKKTLESFFLATWKKMKMNAAHITSPNPTAESKNIVLACTSSHGNDIIPPTEGQGIHRVETPLIEGYIITEVPEGSRWSCTFSVPFTDLNFFGLSSKDEIIIKRDMSLGPSTEAALQRLFEEIEMR